MNKNNGGAVFPMHPGPFIKGEGVAWDGQSGMTLRQYYKAKAIQGMLATGNLTGGPPLYAQEAGEIADAMILEDEEFQKRAQ